MTGEMSFKSLRSCEHDESAAIITPEAPLAGKGRAQSGRPQVEALAKDVISGLSLEISQINSDFGQVRLAILGDILEETVPRIC